MSDCRELRDFDPSLYIERKEGRRMDLYCQYAVYSAAMAAEDAGIYLDKDEADRTGVIYGSGIGGIQTLEDQHQMMITRGPRRINPFFVPMMIADMAAGLISIRLGAKGPNFATVSACASGAHAIGCAFKTIRQGEADVMICGGAEAPITPLAVGGFSSAKTLSTRNEEPERASRPFDAERDGFVIGEGAGTLILEELAHAQARDANIYAEVVGVGFTGDAYHITAPPPGHEGGSPSHGYRHKGRGSGTYRGAVRQRPWDVYTPQRQERDQSPEIGIWRTCVHAGYQLYQVYDRPSAWGLGRGRTDRHGLGHPTWALAPDDQL